MFDKFLAWFGWKKKGEVVVDDTPPWDPAPVTPKVDPNPLVVPDPALLYKKDEQYEPYKGAVDEQLHEMFESVPEKKEIPVLADPPPSIDAALTWYKGPEIKIDISKVEDPMVVAVVEELSKEEKASKLSLKASAPKKKDPLVAATAKVLAQKKAKKVVVKKAVKKTTKKKQKK